MAKNLSMLPIRAFHSLASCHSIADLRAAARRRLPRAMFDYIDGGAEDEVTLRRNNQAFERHQLIPDTLVDVAKVDLSTTVQGTEIELPIIFSPTGSNRLFHHRGELDVAPVAEECGTIYSLSSLASHDIEEVAACGQGKKWFQIYVWKDRSLAREFIQRCRDSGYQALCLTVDVPTFGQRERDLRNGMTVPPRFTLSSLWDMALHPNWWWHVLTSPRITLGNVKDKAGVGLNSAVALSQYIQNQFDPSVTWDDMASMIKEWGGPFLIKGILSADDARRAVEAGVTGIIISNHGGRQLDHAAAPIDMLPEIVEAVGEDTEIILDGGIRRGTDVIKALALGAKACMVGRAYLYGLGAGGRAGVARALEILRSEIIRGMKLLGCPSVKSLEKKFVREIAALETR